MKQRAFNKKLRKILVSKPHVVPKFCDLCGGYNSKFHKLVWCAHCPGKMKGYSEMTWADCLLKSRNHGSGWINSLQDVMDWNVLGLDEFLDLWKGMGGEEQMYKWCEEA